MSRKAISIAKDIFQLVNRKNLPAEFFYEGDWAQCPTVILGERQIQIIEEQICYGTVGCFHLHGCLPIEDIDGAADFLLHPEKMPPSVSDLLCQMVGKLPQGLFVIDTINPLCPIIKNSNDDYAQIGLYNPLTINFFYGKGGSFGLVDVNRAVEFLSKY